MPEASTERETLLKQYIRLPGDPQGLGVQIRLGEILVAFYNYILRREEESDEDDDSERDEWEDSRRAGEVRQDVEDQKSTCIPVPLQYLYRFSDDHEPEMDLSEYLTEQSEDWGDLRIMYVIIKSKYRGNFVLS